MRKLASLYLIYLFSTLVLLSCAKIEFPPGGPPDETPPEIVSTFPEHGALEVPNDAEVRIEFTEKMEQDEAPKSLVIVPEPEEFPDLDWDGSALKIKFKDTLVDNRTYLITLKTGLSDLRNNKLERPYKLAFSTGEVLDTGNISGFVVQDYSVAANVDVWAFVYDTAFSIFDQKPLYITQTSDSGDYKLDYLANGRYICFAVRDQNSDRLFDPESDRIGIPTMIAKIDSANPSITGLNFVLSKQDTSSLRLLSVDYRSDHLIAAEFSDLILSSEVSIADFEITDNENDSAINMLYTYALEDSTDRIMLVPETPMSEGRYMMKARDLMSVYGNELSEEYDTASFEIGTVELSPRPKLVRSIPSDGQADFPHDSDFEFVFSEPIIIDSADTSLVYLLTADSVYLRDFRIRIDRIRLVADYDDTLSMGAEYSLFLNLPSVTDRFGENSAGDSVKIITFTTEDIEDYGSISGKISGIGNPVNSVFYVKSMDRWFSRILQPDDSLRFNISVPAGSYFFYGFDDTDSSGMHFTGAIDNLQYAEPYYLFTDTVSVRARFETEDVVLKSK